MIVQREARRALDELRASFPVVAITGPRQSGKTTLARAEFADKPYVSLEDPSELDFAGEDPRGFLGRFPGGAVLDEVQRRPELLSYLQGIVDADPVAGRFVLTGSQQLAMLSGVTQSLAGRVGLLHLLPFTLAEARAAGFRPASLDDVLATGSYPPIHDRRVRPAAWFANYVQTYVERDVRQMLRVGDLSAFRTFVRVCAGRVGQLLNLSSLAADCGITHSTARAWLSVLEASYLIVLLRPYHRNFTKRMVKTPKLYFYDAGLAAWLVGVRDASHLAAHPLRGALFETWVVSELHKSSFNAGEMPSLYFWRDRAGLEIDVVADEGSRARPVEIKAGATVTSDQLRSLRRWTELAGDVADMPTLVSGGLESYERSGVRVVGWPSIHTI